MLIVDSSFAIVPEATAADFTRSPKPENYQYYHKYVAMDLGVRDLNVTLFAYYDFLRAKIVIEKEHVISGPDMTTPKLHAAISGIEQDLWNAKEPYKRVADNNNPLLLLDLGSIHNMFFHSTSKDSLHAMVNQMRVWIQEGRVEIDESCVVLIDSLKYGIWNKKRAEFERSRVLGHYDAVAALMYLIRNIDESTNPIPVKHSFDQVNFEEDAKEKLFKNLKGLAR